jgi:hypothetical protein
MSKFDLTRIFDNLVAASGERKRGNVVELQVSLADGSVRQFMEAKGLYSPAQELQK